MIIIHHPDPDTTIEAVDIVGLKEMYVTVNSRGTLYHVLIKHGSDDFTSVGWFETIEDAENALIHIVQCYAGNCLVATVEEPKKDERKDRIDYEEYSK